MRLGVYSKQLGLGLGWLAAAVAVIETVHTNGPLQGLVFGALFFWGTIALRIVLQRMNDKCKRYEEMLRNNAS